MPDDGKPPTAEDVFKRIVWRNVLAIGGGMQQFTTWTITGTAGIIAFFVGHLDSISDIVSDRGVSWSLTLLALSVLAGVVSKQFGMAVAHSLVTITKMETFLQGPDGQRLMSEMSIAPKQLNKEIADPFLWPLSSLMRRSGERGGKDHSAADTHFIRLFCVQLYTNLLHTLLAAAAIIILAASIK